MWKSNAWYGGLGWKGYEVEGKIYPVVFRCWHPIMQEFVHASSNIQP